MQFAEPLSTPSGSHYLQLHFNQFSVKGISIAGIETVLTIPQWSLTFDTGRSPDFSIAPKYLALSHWHLDHAGGLASILGLRVLNGLPSLQIIVPKKKREATSQYLKILQELSENELRYEVLTAEEPIKIKETLILKAVPSFHSVPSQGYLISHQKHHLLPEFHGKSQEEIIRAKKTGRKVDASVMEPLLAYSGDTKGNFLDTEAAKATYLMMECSFFGDDADYEKIQHFGHTHIRDWRDRADQIESQYVIMIHTSQRYTRQDIEKACHQNLPKHLLDRLIVFR